MTEADFLARQRIEANDTGSPAVFTDAAYNNWRDDALAAISRAAPLVKSATLAVVDGTRVYDVPADYITVTSDLLDVDGYPVYRITTHDGGILTNGDPVATYQNLLPITRTDFGVRGRSIVLSGDPDYTGDWTLTYGGTWLITELPADWSTIALDHATASAFDARAAAAAIAFKYDNGVESVDDTAEAKRWMELAAARRANAAAALSLISTRSSTTGTFRFERA